jgi:hypothetical protein
MTVFFTLVYTVDLDERFDGKSLKYDCLRGKSLNKTVVTVRRTE